MESSVPSLSHTRIFPPAAVYYLGTLGKATFNFVASSCSFLLRCPPPQPFLPKKCLLKETPTQHLQLVLWLFLVMSVTMTDKTAQMTVCRLSIHPKQSQKHTSLLPHSCSLSPSSHRRLYILSALKVSAFWPQCNCLCQSEHLITMGY